MRKCESSRWSRSVSYSFMRIHAILNNSGATHDTEQPSVGYLTLETILPKRVLMLCLSARVVKIPTVCVHYIHTQTHTTHMPYGRASVADTHPIGSEQTSEIATPSKFRVAIGGFFGKYVRKKHHRSRQTCLSWSLVLFSFLLSLFSELVNFFIVTCSRLYLYPIAQFQYTEYRCARTCGLPVYANFDVLHHVHCWITVVFFFSFFYPVWFGHNMMILTHTCPSKNCGIIP